MEALVSFWNMLLGNPVLLVLFIVAVQILLYMGADAFKQLISTVFINAAEAVGRLTEALENTRARVKETADQQIIAHHERHLARRIQNIQASIRDDLEDTATEMQETNLKVGELITRVTHDHEESLKEDVRNRRTWFRRLAGLFRSMDRVLKRLDTKLDDNSRRWTSFNDLLRQYKELLESKEGREIIKYGSVLTTFIIGILFLPVVAGGAVLNYQLIALPMLEIVGSSTLVAGYPIHQAAALIVILLEATAGILFFEAMRITHLLGLFDGLDRKTRRNLAIFFGSILVILATAEAALAVLRDYVLEATGEASTFLSSGSQPEGEEADAISGTLRTIVQATFGFIIPFVLACVAIPLEMVLTTISTVTAIVVANLILPLFIIISAIFAALLKGFGELLLAIYRIAIFIPESLHKFFKAVFRPRTASPEVGQQQVS